MDLSTRGGILGHRGLWLADVALVGILLVFVVVVAWLAQGPASDLAGIALTIAGLAIALVPALIWLAFFYVQDSLEPEPKAYIAEIFVLGALSALAIGIPLVRDVFQLNRWLYTSGLTHLLGSILVTGFVQEFLIFACVRFSIYQAGEFDQRTDGIVYTTAAALGFATVLNLDYVVSRGGVDLGVGAMRVAIMALAHASIAGIMGYCIGQAKFEHKPLWYVPGAVALAAVLNGLFFWLQDAVTINGLAFTPANGLIAAVAFAVVLLVAALWLVRRANLETVALTEPGAQGGQ
jgi:protease PrsW